MREFTQHETYPLSPDAPRLARHALDQYTGLIEAALLDDLRIVTTELVSNSVQHSGRPEGDPITVTTSLATDVMRVGVVDQGTGPVSRRPPSSKLTSGLEIVEAIGDRWSGLTTPHVWVEIDVVVDGRVKRPGAELTP